MQKRGYLNKLTTYIEEIFQNEINFAQQRLKEVVAMMQKQGAKVEYNTQLVRNIQIFKSNFDVILTATSNTIWNRLIGQVDEDCGTRTETIPSALRKSDLMFRHSDTDLQKFNDISRSPSKNLSAVKQIPLSEISYVSGGSPTSFSRAKRNIDQSLSTSSPGVGKYRTEQADKHVRQSPPNMKIGKSPKISWIDERTKEREASPGPIYNPVKTFCSKKLRQSQ